MYERAKKLWGLDGWTEPNNKVFRADLLGGNLFDLAKEYLIQKAFRNNKMIFEFVNEVHSAEMFHWILHNDVESKWINQVWCKINKFQWNKTQIYWYSRFLVHLNNLTCILVYRFLFFIPFIFFSSSQRPTPKFVFLWIFLLNYSFFLHFFSISRIIHNYSVNIHKFPELKHTKKAEKLTRIDSKWNKSKTLKIIKKSKSRQKVEEPVVVVFIKYYDFFIQIFFTFSLDFSLFCTFFT